MAKWLQSGRRRDICVILADEGSAHAQQVKTRLAERYDERVDPKSFYGALESMEDLGYVETETAGIHEIYALTDAGEARLREQLEWMAESLE